jgi:hypothetical protein
VTAVVGLAGDARADAQSWIDWLLARLDALPGPRWVAYVALFVVLAVLNQVAHWAGGSPIGSVSALVVLEAAYPVLILSGMAALNVVAARSLRQLRPALPITDAEVADIEHDLLRTPSFWAAVAGLLGAVEALFSVLAGPSGYGLGPSSPAILWVAEYVDGALTTALAFAFIAHAIHQLRLVTRVHRDIARVDVFRLDPLYAFASLTAWTGISVLAFGVFGFGSLSLVGGGISFSAVDVATMAGLCVVAAVLFVVPLIGLHGRIQLEKARQRAAAGESMTAAVAELHRRMTSGLFENSKEVSDAIAAATSAYTTISKIPTWPWRQETLRAFLGAAGLPIVLWAVTALLGRVI